MSAFSLGQLAAVAGKHPRTMRRWFDLGFFGQAATRTSGGQRRVCGLSAAMLVASARKQAQGFERARFPKEEKAMRRIKRLARKINRQMANNVPRLDKQTCAVANLVGRLFFILAEVSDDQLEGYGLPPGPVHELAWLTEINEENARSVLVTSLALWMKKSTARSLNHLREPSALAAELLVDGFPNICQRQKPERSSLLFWPKMVATITRARSGNRLISPEDFLVGATKTSTMNSENGEAC